MATSRTGVAVCWKRHRDAKLERLAQAPLLASLTIRDLETVAALCDEISFPARAVLVRKGDRGRFCYLVLHGSTAFAADAVDHALESDLVGLLAAKTGEPQRSTVIAVTPVRALVVDHRWLGAVSERLPAVARRGERPVRRAAQAKSQVPTAVSATEGLALVASHEPPRRLATISPTGFDDATDASP